MDQHESRAQLAEGGPRWRTRRHGNVWEWCEDWYAFYSKASVIDPKGPPHAVVDPQLWDGSSEGYKIALEVAAENYELPVEQQTGNRVIRGGNYMSKPIKWLQSAFRFVGYVGNPEPRLEGVGFRVARDMVD